MRVLLGELAVDKSSGNAEECDRCGGLHVVADLEVERPSVER